MASDTLLYLLPILFILAFLHSSVGLAGGSSYTAYMTLLGLPLPIIPSISLALNTLVSAIAARNFIAYRHFRFDLWLPFQLGALPMVYIGARTILPALVFYALLFVTLLLATLRMLFFRNYVLRPIRKPSHIRVLCLLVGGVLGFLAGSIGIGGGIYLIPFILLFGLADVKQAAAVGIVFIFINSIIGLATRAYTGDVPWNMLWPALLCVGAGSALGSWLGASKWKSSQLNILLIFVLICACWLLIVKIFRLI